ncbi:MAG: GntR family transcriptional regulator [Roseibium sp.]|uniref:GntR family transcriptional regulator n=1 Tax=Roseibium sp. TaxID=1936156 RepID=UPI00262BB70F|nr:GntR family transcriptional regulator [Roseibium sp.]MCV0429946.1 GntR family transcriptional regulator [Roseibium sp.]
MNAFKSRNTVDTSDGKTSVEAIQNEILRRICFLDYEPGIQLKEAELAVEFGVSRTPIRDAIGRIKHLGLVETRNGVGTVVVTLTPDQIRHVYEMRLQLAGLIGTMSPREATGKDLVRITDLLNAAIELELEFDARAYVELNDLLQDLIADLIGNTLLKSFWRQAYFQAASTWYRVASLAGSEVALSLVQELRELKEALERNDMVAVGLVQRIHIGYGYQRITRFLSCRNEET